jgi:branched-chain amino acid transport system permease protein
VILGVALSVIIGFTLWLYKSRNGRALRAASEDREVAQLMGVPVLRLTSIVFAVGVGFAGLAGALVSSIAVVQPFMSANYLLKGFIIAIVGGLGNVTGTFVVGLFVALTEALSAQYLPVEWIDGYVGVFMIIILLIRPSGLFGVQRG